jgi:hypothetical protein
MVRRHLRDKFVSDVAKECLDRLLQRYVQELLQRSGFNVETAAGVERDKRLVETLLGPLVQGKVSVCFALFLFFFLLLQSLSWCGV